jgi:hypothetical protein
LAKAARAFDLADHRFDHRFAHRVDGCRRLGPPTASLSIIRLLLAARHRNQ